MNSNLHDMMNGDLLKAFQNFSSYFLIRNYFNTSQQDFKSYLVWYYINFKKVQFKLNTERILNWVAINGEE